MNAEFQTIARRYKKTFLSDQCKEIEEKNRIGKTRDLFKKIKRYQGNISCKYGLNKGQKQYGPNRAEDIKKGWQEYTEEQYKKIFMAHYCELQMLKLCVTLGKFWYGPNKSRRY